MDWSALALGLAVGAGVSAAFFVGLMYGMRVALRTPRPLNLLMLSAVLRIAVLLGIGWAVVGLAGPFAFAGYVLAFVMTRTIALAIARSGASIGDKP